MAKLNPKENRVRIADYGSVPQGDPRLIPVPSKGRQQHLHWAAAASLAAMSSAAESDGLGKIVALSAWRPRRWSSRAAYEKQILATAKYHRKDAYGDIDRKATLRAGANALAYQSAHETGLAIDIGSKGFSANSSAGPVAAMRQLPLYLWLAENADHYGWTPYNREPWHWEMKVDRAVWDAGPDSNTAKAAASSSFGWLRKWGPVGAVAFLGLRFALGLVRS